MMFLILQLIFQYRPEIHSDRPQLNFYFFPICKLHNNMQALISAVLWFFHKIFFFHNRNSRYPVNKIPHPVDIIQEQTDHTDSRQIIDVCKHIFLCEFSLLFYHFCNDTFTIFQSVLCMTDNAPSDFFLLLKSKICNLCQQVFYTVQIFLAQFRIIQKGKICSQLSCIIFNLFLVFTYLDGCLIYCVFTRIYFKYRINFCFVFSVYFSCFLNNCISICFFLFFFLTFFFTGILFS